MTSREATERTATTGPAPVLEEYVTIDDVAAALKVHYNTVYRATQDGRIPVIRLGRAIRIKVSDLDRLRHSPGGLSTRAPATVRAPRARAPRGEFARRARGLPPREPATPGPAS